MINKHTKQSKKEGKDQESIQSSITHDPGYQWESDNFTIRAKKCAWPFIREFDLNSLGSYLGYGVFSEDSDQTKQMPRLI